MNPNIKSFLPHFIALILFVVCSLVFFYPVLQGKHIFQSDIVQYTGMAKERNDYRNTDNKESYWTNSAFGGMPTYQLGAQYENHYIKSVDKLLRFLPRPADYLFLYFIGFYVLMFVLKRDHKLAFLGSLAFGFSTYLVIIIGVGHNAKVHAIAYMPLVLAGLFLVFQKKYFIGFVLSALTMGLELVANHYQMTYYLLLLMLVIGLVYLADAIKNKTLPHFLKSIGILAAAYILAIGMNATSLLATQEYAKESTRGVSSLTINPDGSPREKSGLSKEYITEYSYGITESFNLFISRFMGGGSHENVGDDSAMNELLAKMGLPASDRKEIVKAMPTYWGQQPIVAAPAYIGVVVFFLAFLGIFLTKGKTRRWLLIASGLALLLSWGKNFSILTDLFINYFPMYDKFRAVSSIQVIIELCFPVLAVLGLYKIFSEKISFEEKKKALIYTGGILGGLCLIFLLLGKNLFSFAGGNDDFYIQNYGIEFVDALKEDRISFFMTDTFRSLMFIIAGMVLVWFFIKQKLNKNTVVVIFALLLLIDLIPVDKRYVNAENFTTKYEVENPFTAYPVDKEILKDGSHYRVYDLTTDPFSSGRASFFHNALGGYHAAKPRKMQDLYDFYLGKGLMEIFNMLNVKYILIHDEEVGVSASVNDAANGNAWFVSEVISVKNDDEEILALSKIDTKTTAVVNAEYISSKSYTVDTTAAVKLITVKPDYLYYETENPNDGLVVFSEIYYPHGWKAMLNGKEVPHFRVDYTLRALEVPKGYNKIEFVFEPKVVKTGSTITLATSVLFILLIIGGIFLNRKKT